ncbi:ABC transporter substrate-binding protein [Criibacterium bergeronii]|uniref:ABC transporter substrate-binding protein n=1 Tax=Criibacterium bergeronii TaxID=1871336 RepID=A0A552VE36_9FIRM|nr:zinc ABC transporter substrate-binding protein [Criibacterium bergeronii]TRW28679.1 ABC transporter substrate-binding protein [Criibacterium bergeronii]
MKKTFVKILSLAVATAMLGACTPKKDQAVDTQSNGADSSDKIKVVASMYPIYDFTKKIAGDKVDLVNIVPAGTEPHGFELSSDNMVTLEKADLLIYNGAGMESWIEDAKGAVTNDKISYVDTSEGIDLIKNEHQEDADEHEHECEEAHDEHEGEEAHEEHECEEHHHHEHGMYDPHIWLGLKEAQMQVTNIKNALVEKDPTNKDFYEKNYEEYIKKLQDTDKAYEEKLKDFQGRGLVTSHEAFAYLCRDYGLTQMGIEGVFEDSEPDPATMKNIIQYIKDNNIKTIFQETLSSSKTVDSISKETGATVDVLDPLEGLTKEAEDAGEDYLSIMNKNLDKIVNSFK